MQSHSPSQIGLLGKGGAYDCNPNKFHITATGRPYSGLGLSTTKHERMLGVSTLSYKLNALNEFLYLITMLAQNMVF